MPTTHELGYQFRTNFSTIHPSKEDQEQKERNYENRGHYRKNPAGLMFLVFGLNPFLKFLPMPPLEGVWGQFLGALVVSRYVWFVGAVQVISGALFLIGRYVPLAIALSGPVVANIIVYHLTMQHTGAQPAVLAIICWVILFWHYRASFAPLWVQKA